MTTSDNPPYSTCPQGRRKKLKGKQAKGIPAKKPREYFKISYDSEGLPKVSTLVDVDPYNLEERYEMLMREA